MDNKILMAAVIVLLATNALTLAYIFSERDVKPAPGPRTTLGSPSSIPLAAVSHDGTGVIARVNLEMIEGSGKVLINTNPFAEPDLQYSLNKAVRIASEEVGGAGDVDFIYTYEADSPTLLVGGESAGAASTILAIAALEGKELKRDTILTGTIEADGSIGEVGGIVEKAEAAGRAGYANFLVPAGQSTLTYYEKVITSEPVLGGFAIRNVRYIPRQIDLKNISEEEWGIKIIEVRDIEEALPYFI